MSDNEPADASVSRNYLSPAPQPTSSRLMDRPTSRPSQPMSEREPLLGANSRPAKKPFYRPRPLWLVPFAFTSSMVRSMTLAPRVQVYTQLSCNALYGHDVYDHTNTSILASNIHAPLPLDESLLTIDTSRHIIADQPTSFPVTFVRPSAFDESDDDEPDPRLPPSKRCLGDPAVQAGAARIQMIMTTTMGIVSALTAGFWSAFGDRHGRTRVLAISTLGLFLTDLVFILVSTPHSIFAAHGHKLLIISPAIEGLLGGWSTVQAAMTSYVSDCTSDGSRAHIFSKFQGVYFFGVAFGPMIGAFLIRHPILSIGSPSAGVHNGSPTVTSVFYVAATASCINFILALFLFPESLTKKKAKANTQHVTIASMSSAPVEVEEQSVSARFLSPFAVFVPKTVDVPGSTAKRRDWTVTLLAVTLFVHFLTLGLFQIKYLYAEHIYGWNAEKLSYYITIMGSTRALYMLVVLPFLIAKFKPKPKPATNVAGTSSQPAKKAKPTAAHLAKEMRFDLLVMRGSILIDIVSHSLVAFSSNDLSQAFFVAFTSLSSVGAGLVPATNSLALCALQSRGEDGTGKLFGALSMLQAVGAMMLGPLLFGTVYAKTVAAFPRAVFFLAGGILVIPLVVLCFVRPPSVGKGRKRIAASREESVVERGRSRASKDLGWPSGSTVPRSDVDVHT